MLQKLRDKSSGWIASVILGLLIIPFAFVGLEQYLVPRTDTVVASIHSPPQWWSTAPQWGPMGWFWDQDDITVDEFRSRFEQVRQQQRAQQGEAFDANAFESVENKRAILDSLIDQEVQRLASIRAGIVVSDELVRRTIQEIPDFQVDGKFNMERYQLALASQAPSQTPTGFDQNIRESLQQTLVSGAVAQSNFVTATEFERLISLLGETRDASLVMLPAPPQDTAAVSAAEIQAWYDARKATYRLPESVSIEYVELDAAAMPAPPPPSEASLRERFEEEKSRFLAQEQRLASHILVTVEEGADANAQKVAQQKATQVAAQVRQVGADFAAIARVSSEDTGSRTGGGDLGWVGKGMMPAAFETALFALQPGQISAPVKSEFGWHVIKLREIRSGQQESFETARESLLLEQVAADRERAFNAVVGQLVDAVLENPDSLVSAARGVNLPIRRVGPLTRNAADNPAGGIASNPAIVRAAFSDALIQDGTVSDPIEVAPNHNAWIRVTAHTPERIAPLPRVRDQVIAAIRLDRTRSAATRRADALLARLRGGETLQALSVAENLPAPQVVPGIQRGMPLPDVSVSDALFAVPAPAAGRSTPAKTILADGRVVLFTLDKVTAGNIEQLDPQQRTQLQEQVAQMGGMADAEAIVAALRKRMKIELFENNL